MSFRPYVWWSAKRQSRFPTSCLFLGWMSFISPISLVTAIQTFGIDSFAFRLGFPDTTHHQRILFCIAIFIGRQLHKVEGKVGIVPDLPPAIDQRLVFS